MSVLTLKEREILLAVNDCSGLAHTRKIAKSVERFGYEAVRRTLNQLAESNHVVRTRESHINGYLWEITAKAKLALSDN